LSVLADYTIMAKVENKNIILKLEQSKKVIIRIKETHQKFKLKKVYKFKLWLKVLWETLAAGKK